MASRCGSLALAAGLRSGDAGVDTDAKSAPESVITSLFWLAAFAGESVITASSRLAGFGLMYWPRGGRIAISADLK
jgi:hypothetical protein